MDKYFDDFIKRWNGKGVDTDNAFGQQCMDLMHQFCLEVLSLPDVRILAAPAAKDVYLNFNNILGKEHFEKIANTPTGVPKKGDIVLWGTGLGPFGHVGIFIDGDVNKFNSFDQNFPVGSKCHVQPHNYIGVLGWLRKREIIPQPIWSDQTRVPANFLTSPSYPVPEDYLELQQIRGIFGDYGRAKKKIVELQTKIDKAKQDLA